LGDVESQLYRVTTPSKINLVIGHTNTISGQTNTSSNISKQLWFFALTHFNYCLLFLLFLYYTINPALLSLPLLIYIFAYYLIADIKHNHYLFLYIFLLVLLAELFQLNLFPTSQWTYFFFYLPQNYHYRYDLAYLFLLLVVILVDEEIKRYQGANLNHHSQV
jgi:hypothetical protein